MGIANIIGAITGSGVSEAAKGVGDVIDKVFTSDDERLSRAETLERIKQHSDEMQVEINKIDAQSKNIFQAGWRPFIGWCCGFGVAYSFIIWPIFSPILNRIFGFDLYELDNAGLMVLLSSLLGMTYNRTYEKMKGIAK